MSEVAESFLLETIKSLRGLKSNVEKALDQITGEEMHFRPDKTSNNIAILMKHLSGNMISRFTDFLTTDGEKEWRNRDNEFIDDSLSSEELFKIWNRGWECLDQALNNLKPEDLLKVIKIRGEEHTVIRALNRQLVHYAYHAGQMVYLCKQIRTTGFNSLSIPLRQS